MHFCGEEWCQRTNLWITVCGCGWCQAPISSPRQILSNPLVCLLTPPHPPTAKNKQQTNRGELLVTHKTTQWRKTCPANNCNCSCKRNRNGNCIGDRPATTNALVVCKSSFKINADCWNKRGGYEQLTWNQREKSSTKSENNADSQRT